MSTTHEPSTHDEYYMQQSLLFSDSLRSIFCAQGVFCYDISKLHLRIKDLKHLRTQLYSAAEYFEVSYTKDDQKEVVVNTLKEYTVKALVNTVDHLGSISYKVNDLIDEKVDEVLGTELRVSCIQQRLRTCQECMDREGFSQQSFGMTFPKYHKRYTLPDKEGKHNLQHSASQRNKRGIGYEEDWNHLKNAVRTSMRAPQTSTIRKGHSPSPSPRSLKSGNFSFRDKRKNLEKRTDSPLPSKFPLLRSGSLSSWATTPKPSRPTTPNLSNTSLRYPSEPRRTSSIRVHDHNDIEQHPSKSKRLLKALLSRGRSKKDDKLYTFLDEY